jgi:hypothetical protein
VPTHGNCQIFPLIHASGNCSVINSNAKITDTIGPFRQKTTLLGVLLSSACNKKTNEATYGNIKITNLTSLGVGQVTWSYFIQKTKLRIFLRHGKRKCI